MLKIGRNPQPLGDVRLRFVIALVALVAASTVILGAAPSAAGEDVANLVPNGGFEVDVDGDGRPEGWQTPPLPGARMVPAARSGQAGLLLLDPPTGQKIVEVASERFPIPVGQPLTFSAWYLPVPNAIGGSQVELRCFSPIYNPRVITVGESVYDQLGTAGEWRKLQFTFEPAVSRQYDSCGVTLRLGGGAFAPGVGAVDGAGGVVFDDLALVVGKQPGS